MDLSAMMYAARSAGGNAPFYIEGWLNADTKDQAIELAKSFPEFVELNVKGQYRRLYFRSYAENGIAAMVEQTDAFLAACEANGIFVDWFARTDAYYTAEEFDQYVRPLAK